VPLLAGATADAWGLRKALAVPAICYCVILLFGLYARRPMVTDNAKPASAGLV
jgi:FHS family L-fucose permease-like MFS transporter